MHQKLVEYVRKLSTAVAATSALALLAPLDAAADTDRAGHDQSLRILVSATSVTLITSVPEQQLLAFDSNNDGRLSRQEFDARRDQISHFIDTNLNLISADGLSLPLSFSDMPISGYRQLAPDDKIGQLRIIRRYAIPEGDRAQALITTLPFNQDATVNYQIVRIDGQSRGQLEADDARIIALI